METQYYKTIDLIDEPHRPFGPLILALIPIYLALPKIRIRKERKKADRMKASHKHSHIFYWMSFPLNSIATIFRSSASFKLDLCHRLTYSLTTSISMLFGDQFGRALRFRYQ